MTFERTVAAISLVEAFGLVGFGLLTISILMLVGLAVRNGLRATRRTISRRRQRDRMAADGRRIADPGYTELAENWFKPGLPSPRFAALNQLDFMLGGIFEVAYDDPALDAWMQDVYAHICDRDLMAVASQQWLTEEERSRLSARREEMRSPDYEP